MKKIIATAIAVAALAVPASAASIRNVVREDAPVYYTFLVAKTGIADLTVTWVQPHRDTFSIMVCSPDWSASDPFTVEWTSFASEERFTELSAGLLGGLDCAFGVATLGRPASVTAVLSVSSSDVSLAHLKAADGRAADAIAERVEAIMMRLKPAPRESD